MACAMTALFSTIGVGVVAWLFSTNMPLYVYFVLAFGVLLFAGSLFVFFFCLCMEKYEDITDVYDHLYT